MKYQSSSKVMSSFKVVLISTSVLSAAIVLKLSAPAITEITECIPSIYDGVVSWLRPPYLYLVVNFIIITIVASSKLHSGKVDGVMSSPVAQEPLDAGTNAAHLQPLAVKNIRVDYPMSDYKYDGFVPSAYEVELGKAPELESFERADATGGTLVSVVGGENGDAFARDATSNKENEFVIEKSSWTVSENRGSAENSPLSAKPPVSTRFGHRRNVKASPEGVKTVLGVSRPKRQDTLENTWRTITEGRPIPITRHLKKSDTWERDGRRQLLEKTPPPKTMKKAETFNDRTNTQTPSTGDSGRSGKLRREASLSQDELNRRVEAFIKKFNEEMRLQRQESLNQYTDMISRGAH